MDIKGGNLTKHRKNIAVLGLLIAIAVMGLLGRLAFLMILRTEYAFREMLHTDRSLNDIAINNGFPNSRAFAKSFFKRYDCLPGEYRRKMQLTASDP